MIRKNYIVKKRRKCATFGEFLTPLLFCLVLTLLTGNNIDSILDNQAGRCKLALCLIFRNHHVPDYDFGTSDLYNRAKIRTL